MISLGIRVFGVIDVQIVDAILIAASKQRNNVDDKNAIKSGKSAAEIWPDEPNKARQKDVNARWTVKQSKTPMSKQDGRAPTGDLYSIFRVQVSHRH